MFILKAIFYTPLYNLFVLFLHIPHIDAGIAVILFTILVKIILFPLSKKALRSQIQLKEVDGDLKALKETYKNDQQTLAKKTMALYKERGINPFSSFLVILIQIPIIFSLYAIFQSNAISEINTTLLYPFVHVPGPVATTFLGLFSVLVSNPYLAVVTAVTQFIQAQLQVMPVSAKKPGQKASFQDDFSRSMNMQIKYILPAFIFFVSFTLPAVISLYWITSNLFTIGQEVFLREERRRLKELHK